MELLKSAFPVRMARRQITLKHAAQEDPELQMVLSVPVVILLVLEIRILIKLANVAAVTSMLGSHVMKLLVFVNASTTHVAIIAKHVALGTMAIL